MYDAGDYKLNECIEVIGVIENTQSAESAGIDDHEVHGSNFLSRSKIPHLHVIMTRPLPALAAPSQMSRSVVETRERLLRFLAEKVGDELLAEYLLLHMLSRIYARHESLTLGAFPLNVSKGSPDLSAHVTEALESVLPRVVSAALTLEMLNKSAFAPRQDESTQNLLGGFLQLANGTALVLDETALNPGKLDENGMQRGWAGCTRQRSKNSPHCRMQKHHGAKAGARRAETRLSVELLQPGVCHGPQHHLGVGRKVHAQGIFNLVVSIGVQY